MHASRYTPTQRARISRAARARDLSVSAFVLAAATREKLFLFHTQQRRISSRSSGGTDTDSHLKSRARERWTQRKSRAGLLDAYLSAARNATHAT